MTFYFIYIIILILIFAFFVLSFVYYCRRRRKERMGYRKEKVILELEPFDESEIDFNREEVQSNLLIDV